MHLLPSLHILCFGDSLTAGYSQKGNLYHPYAGALMQRLEVEWKEVRVSTYVEGRNGDQVTTPPGGFWTRMDILYEETHPHNPYNLAIILGGTNDLGQHRLPIPIYTSLQSTWSIPLSHPIPTRVLALTVPECGDCPDWMMENREELNGLILGHEEEGFYTFDLSTSLPYFDMPEEERKEIWDDDVHLTAKGYDLMGTLIAERIVELFGEEFEEMRGRLVEESKEGVEVGKGELRKRGEGEEQVGQELLKLKGGLKKKGGVVVEGPGQELLKLKGGPKKKTVRVEDSEGEIGQELLKLKGGLKKKKEVSVVDEREVEVEQELLKLKVGLKKKTAITLEKKDAEIEDTGKRLRSGGSY